MFKEFSEEEDRIGREIVNAAFQVHKELGPGLLESVYHYALLKELEIRNIVAKSKVPVPLFYKGFDTGKYFEIDILVCNEIIIEIKAVEILHPVFDAQIISYLKLSKIKLGYLVNFNVPVLKDGFKRFVNNF